jgi:hypothetical protein
VIVVSSAFAYVSVQNVNANGSNKNALFIASFSPDIYGDNISGGNITLVNPSNKNFDNLQLTAIVDDSPVAVTNLHSTRMIYVHDPRNQTMPFDFADNFTEITIEPNQTRSIQFTFAYPEITLFSQHTVKLYLSQNNLGDVINGQSFTILQRKAYLQILVYSSIQHDNDTWHEHFNSAKNRNEYVNDQPNFFQKSNPSRYFPLEPNSYNWAKTLNQIGENYFNVTVCNNNTFPVKTAMFSGGPSVDGQSYLASALLNDALQPNETCVIPVSLLAFPAYSYASGDLVSNQPVSSSTQSESGVYLHFPSDYQGGAETMAYLIDSQLYYGNYNQSFTRSGATGSYSINNGDACVIINGTIRNDYSKDYYFSITANVYNSTNQKVGPILTADSPQPGFTVTKVSSNSTGTFEIQIRYDGKDITSYALLLAFEPTETAPP